MRRGKRRMPNQKNDLLTLLFLIVGLVAAVDLVYVSVQQKANEQQAREKLDCVVQVVEAIKDRQPFPECEIAWER